MSYAQLSEESDRGGDGGGDHRRGSSAGLLNGDSMNGGEPSSSTLAQSIAGLVKGNRTSLSEPLTANGDETNNGTGGGNNDAATDPFYVFQEDLDRKIAVIDESLAEYLRVVHHTDTAVNAQELKDAKKQLKRSIKNAESTLKDVHMAVQLIENDRERFSHIDDTELYERRTLVQTSRDRMIRAKDDIQSKAVKAKLLADERAKALRRAATSDNLGARTDAERDNTDFIVDSQARASLLMQHQEDTLDELDVAVSRVGVMAESIHEEIGHQNKMLGEMEEDLADAEEQLGLVMGKLAKFLKTKDKWQLGTIVGLFLTMIVLLFLVMYT